MNPVEEKLWNYIDGGLPPDEQEAIARLIETDEVYRRKYEELLALDMDFSNMELDEPPMAFTYNVMEGIRAEEARVPLKAAINKNIIRGITGFFILTITALIVYLVFSVNWHTEGTEPIAGFSMQNVKLPNLQHVFTSPVMKGFLFFDLVAALFLFDAYLRRHKLSKETEA